MKIFINHEKFTLENAYKCLFNSNEDFELDYSAQAVEKVEKSHRNFLSWFEKKVPIYGTTTGFGESCYKIISSDNSHQLQDNLVSYLLVGTGDYLPEHIAKGILLFRIVSLSRGYSGISIHLLHKMKELYNKKIYPVIPREGSLGASGDLVPLAYLANNIRGQGEVYYQGEICNLEDLISVGLYEPYVLKPKEGLAIVNGTTAMAALSLHNLRTSIFLTDLAALSSSWLCLAVKGRKEAFSDLVNAKSKTFLGQKLIGKKIYTLLEEENYEAFEYSKIEEVDGITSHLIQDPYSLRCAPQILGPIVETLDKIEEWIELEINGVSDNPLFDQESNFAGGGNFYGGYLAHSMDYLKICLGNLSDLIDRQLTLLISDKTNRGLPANLVNEAEISIEERHLHHGLKGVHQLVSALTSEIMAKAIPNSIFSRSSESHNQDKVSLGMSAATQCYDQLDKVTTIFSCYMICLAQALDLRGIELIGEKSKEFYNLVRSSVPLTKKDQRLDKNISNLKNKLTTLALEKGSTDV